MPRTRIKSDQVEDGFITRDDLNTVTAGQAVVRKLIAGTGITFSSTGVDAGTGDVTINATGGGGSTPTGTGFYRVTAGVMDGAAVGETGTGTVVRSVDSVLTGSTQVAYLYVANDLDVIGNIILNTFSITRPFSDQLRFTTSELSPTYAFVANNGITTLLSLNSTTAAFNDAVTAKSLTLTNTAPALGINSIGGYIKAQRWAVAGQYITVEGGSVGGAGDNYINGYSLTGAAKFLVFGSTTDAVNTAPSSGTCGFRFYTLGVLTLDVQANSFAYLTNKFTVGSTGNGTFAGSVTSTTAAAGTNSAVLASTAYVRSAGSFAVYRTVLDSSCSYTAANIAASYGMGQGAPAVRSGIGSLESLNTIYIDAADYPNVDGIAPKLRIRGQLYTNDVAPGGSYTLGLYPVTRPLTSGGAGLCIYNLGTVIAGSNGASFATPAADAILTAVGADFALPATGHYVVGFASTATAAASSHVHVSASLQMRYS